MDATSDCHPPDGQLDVGGLHQTPPTPNKVYDKMDEPETEAQEVPLTQEPKDSVDQKSDVNEKESLKDKNVEVATKNNEKPGPGQESGTSKKQQLVVKLKYKTKATTTFPPGHRSLANASPLLSSLVGELSGVSNPSNGNTAIGQETGEHSKMSSQNLNLIDPQIMIESSGNDEALALKPLNEPTEELSQVKITKDEPDHDVHRQVEHSCEGLIKDEMKVDAHLGDDDMHVPVNNDMSETDVTSAGAAAPEPDAAQEIVTVEECRVDDVDGDYQQSENASQDAARGGHVGLEDEYMSDEIDPDDWFMKAMNQYGNVGEASGYHRSQDYRAIDHQVKSSDFVGDGIDVQKQDQVEQAPQTCNTGLSDLNVQDVWNEPHTDFSNPVHSTDKSFSPDRQNSPVSTPTVTLKGFVKHQTPPLRHVSRQSFEQCIQPNSDLSLYRQQQLQTQVEEKKRQLENLKELHKGRPPQFQPSPYDFGYPRNQVNTPPPFVTGPLTYQRAPQFSNQQFSNGLKSTGLQQPTLPAVPYGQIPPNMSYSFNPASIYDKAGESLVPHGSKNWIPGPYVSHSFLNVRKKVSDEHDCGRRGNASDDDEPLRTRVKRHPSVTGDHDSVIGMSPPFTASHHIVRHPQQDDDSDVEFVTSKTKPKPTAPTVVQKQVGRPLPQSGSSSPPADNASSYSSNAGEIDWTLPRYEIQRQPLAKGEEIPSAKVSLPGLVREELLLSPDHADEEVHLLMNIFMPNQRALPEPDPEPAIALLNFHNIAVMVIEAYVQYEIGDEFGTGRGHFHTEHDRGDAEYERMRDAVDADTNEIFFAVVDRYRAGLESKKKPLQLIRGTQEFCDLALDIIYYIKEHGLIRPEPKARAVRVDKGVKRGPKGGAKAEETKGKGTKRGTAAKPNEVQPRKKMKTAAVVEVKKKVKSKTLGVTVVRG